MPASPTVVLVPDAWHDARCWDLVGLCLDGRRTPWRTLTLPSSRPKGGAPDPVGSAAFSADVGAVLSLIDSIGDEVVLCGHGYGGMVVSEAGNHPAVRRLVLVAAFCPEPGESVARMVGHWPSSPLGRPLIRIRRGWSELSDRLAPSMCYGDLPPAQARAAAARLCLSSAAVLEAPVERPAWQRKSTVYGLCLRDRVIGFQRSRDMAKRVIRSQINQGRTGSHSVLIDAGHNPCFSRPGRVADLLAPEL